MRLYPLRTSADFPADLNARIGELADESIALEAMAVWEGTFARGRREYTTARLADRRQAMLLEELKIRETLANLPEFQDPRDREANDKDALSLRRALEAFCS